MPPIEVGTTRAIGAVGAEVARRTSSPTTTPAPAPAASATASPTTANPATVRVATSEALDPGAAPVDSDRVAQIRKAVESGEYPLIPARIADAMIAAGMFLRTAKP